MCTMMWVLFLFCYPLLLVCCVKTECTNSNQLTVTGYYQEIVDNGLMEVPPTEDVKIYCCHPSKGSTRQWIRESDGMVIGRLSASASTPRMYTMVDNNEQLVLIIRNSSRKDDGRYKCVSSSLSLKSSVELTVRLELPNTNTKTSSQVFPKDKPTIIVCPTNEIERSITLWFYYDPSTNKPVLFNMDTKTANVVVSDKMTRFHIVNKSKVPRKVFCRTRIEAVNEFTWHAIHWDDYDPIAVTMTTEPADRLLEGGSARIICSFTYLKSATQYVEWRMNDDRPLPHGLLAMLENGRGSIYTASYSRPQKTMYTCRVLTTRTFQFGPKTTVINASITPEVVMRPKIVSENELTQSVDEGSPVSLVCRAFGTDIEAHFTKRVSPNEWSNVTTHLSGDPNYQITVKVDPEDALYTTLTYTIKRAQTSDRGFYKCMVNNRAGSSSADGVIYVKFLARFIGPSVDNPETIYFYQKPIDVNCAVEGYPISKNLSNMEFKSEGKVLNTYVRPSSDSVYNITYNVQLSESNGISQTGTCIYKKNNVIVKKEINFKIAKAPKKPTIKFVCSSNTEAVFLTQKDKLPDDAPSYERIVNEYVISSIKDSSGSVQQHQSVSIPTEPTYISINRLTPSQEYSIEWNWANSFTRSESQTFTVSTAANIKPPPIAKNITAWGQTSASGPQISIRFHLISLCPYSEVPEIGQVLLKYRSAVRSFGPDGNILIQSQQDWSQRQTIGISQKQWEDAARGPITISVSIPNIKTNLQIHLASSNREGNSAWTEGFYTAGIESHNAAVKDKENVASSSLMISSLAIPTCLFLAQHFLTYF